LENYYYPQRVAERIDREEETIAESQEREEDKDSDYESDNDNTSD
jgi:hypothetical protein